MFQPLLKYAPTENHHRIIVRGLTSEVSQADHHHKVHAASSPAFGLPCHVKLSFTGAQQLLGEQLCQPHWSSASFREREPAAWGESSPGIPRRARCWWMAAIRHASTAPTRRAGTAACELLQRCSLKPPAPFVFQIPWCSHAGLLLKITLSASTKALAFGRIRCVV